MITYAAARYEAQKEGGKKGRKEGRKSPVKRIPGALKLFYFRDNA